jgi:hypothetical protein
MKRTDGASAASRVSMYNFTYQKLFEEQQDKIVLLTESPVHLLDTIGDKNNRETIQIFQVEEGNKAILQYYLINLPSPSQLLVRVSNVETEPHKIFINNQINKYKLSTKYKLDILNYNRYWTSQRRNARGFYHLHSDELHVDINTADFVIVNKDVLDVPRQIEIVKHLLKAELTSISNLLIPAPIQQKPPIQRKQTQKQKQKQTKKFTLELAQQPLKIKIQNVFNDSIKTKAELATTLSELLKELKTTTITSIPIVSSIPNIKLTIELCYWFLKKSSSGTLTTNIFFKFLLCLFFQECFQIGKHVYCIEASMYYQIQNYKRDGDGVIIGFKIEKEGRPGVCQGNVITWDNIQKIRFNLLGDNKTDKGKTKSVCHTLFQALSSKDKNSPKLILADYIFECINWSVLLTDDFPYEFNNIILFIPHLPPEWNMNVVYNLMWEVPHYSYTLVNSVRNVSYCIQHVWNSHRQDTINMTSVNGIITVLKFMKTIGDLSQVIFAISQKIIHFTQDSACKTYSYLYIKDACTYIISAAKKELMLEPGKSIITRSYLRCCIEDRIKYNKAQLSLSRTAQRDDMNE